jgi:adenylate cyclase
MRHYAQAPSPPYDRLVKVQIKYVQSWLGGLIGALLAVGLGLALHVFRFGLGLICWSYDLPFVARPLAKPEEVVMIYMDDESHERLGQPLNAPWDRALHAQLVNRLTAAGARAIVFDIVFSDPAADSAKDQQFVQAIRQSRRVILAADMVPAGYGTEANQRRPTLPTDLLRNVAADVGTAETVPSYDFAIRQHFHGMPDDLLATLSWVAASFVGAPVTKNPEQRTRERWVNYYGPPGSIRNVSYYRALDPAATPDAVFRDRVAFIGARLFTRFAGERKDEFRNPWSYWSSKDRFMSGVEVQATMFLNLLRGDWLKRWSETTERALLVILGLVVGFALFQARPVIATATAAGLSTAIALGAWALFVGQRVWFPWLLVIAQIALATFGSVVFNSIRLYIQKKLYEQTLALYLSPKLVKKFSGDRSTAQKFLKPGAEKQTLTILFTDIANFTSISEGMDSDELAHVMNQYFQNAVSHCIHPTDGTVVKYIGDAIFAFWNAPDAQSDHQLRACQAALRFARQEPMLMNGQPLITRIGLHTGVANVGNFGSTTRVDYTALGENINLASRMEGLNKYLGTIVLATGDTCDSVAGRVVSRYCGRFRLKGFEKAVDVHELVSMVEEAEASLPWREAFAEGLKRFQQRDFDAAEAAFLRTLKLHPNDGPSKFFLARLPEFRQHPPPAEWNGEVELKEK